MPSAALEPLTGALSGGQVHAAAQGAQQAASASGGQSAGQQAFDLVNNAGTSAVVDSLNHITLIAAVIAFTAAVLCLVLIRQKDFVVRGGPPPAVTEGAEQPESEPSGHGGAHAARVPAGEPSD